MNRIRFQNPTQWTGPTWLSRISVAVVCFILVMAKDECGHDCCGSPRIRNCRIVPTSSPGGRRATLTPLSSFERWQRSIATGVVPRSSISSTEASRGTTSQKPQPARAINNDNCLTNFVRHCRSNSSRLDPIDITIPLF